MRRWPPLSLQPRQQQEQQQQRQRLRNHHPQQSWLSVSKSAMCCCWCSRLPWNKRTTKGRCPSRSMTDTTSTASSLRFSFMSRSFGPERSPHFRGWLFSNEGEHQEQPQQIPFDFTVARRSVWARIEDQAGQLVSSPGEASACSRPNFMIHGAQVEHAPQILKDRAIISGPGVCGEGVYGFAMKDDRIESTLDSLRFGQRSGCCKGAAIVLKLDGISIQGNNRYVLPPGQSVFICCCSIMFQCALRSDICSFSSVQS